MKTVYCITILISAAVQFGLGLIFTFFCNRAVINLSNYEISCVYYFAMVCIPVGINLVAMAKALYFKIIDKRKIVNYIAITGLVTIVFQFLNFYFITEGIPYSRILPLISLISIAYGFYVSHHGFVSDENCPSNELIKYKKKTLIYSGYLVLLFSVFMQITLGFIANSRVCAAVASLFFLIILIINIYRWKLCKQLGIRIDKGKEFLINLSIGISFMVCVIQSYFIQKTFGEGMISGYIVIPLLCLVPYFLSIHNSDS
jgi:hypothetical protein